MGAWISTGLALLLCTVIVARKGYVKYLWIPLVPFVFDIAVTFTASFQKIVSTDPKIGYWQQWRNARELAGTLTDQAAIADNAAVIRNTFIQGTMSIVFVAAVAFVIVCAAITVARVLRRHEVAPSEDPVQESNFYAPTHLIATPLEKKLVREYAVVGDPDLVPGVKHGGQGHSHATADRA